LVRKPYTSGCLCWLLSLFRFAVHLRGGCFRWLPWFSCLAFTFAVHICLGHSLFPVCHLLFTVHCSPGNSEWQTGRMSNSEWRMATANVRHLPFAIHCSPFTIYLCSCLHASILTSCLWLYVFAGPHLSFAIRHSPFAIVPFAIRHSPFAIRRSPCVIRHSPFAISPFAFRHSPFAICHSPFAVRLSPFAIRHVSFAICHLPFAVCHSLFASIVLLSSAFPTLVFGPTHFGPMIHLPPRSLP
jgi:hypothetical protein